MADVFTDGHFIYLMKIEHAKVLCETMNQLNVKIDCPCCGSNKTYVTNAIHCNRCAVTTEI